MEMCDDRALTHIKPEVFRRTLHICPKISTIDQPQINRDYNEGKYTHLCYWVAY